MTLILFGALPDWTGRPQRRSEVGWPFHFGRGNDSEDVELFVS